MWAPAYLCASATRALAASGRRVRYHDVDARLAPVGREPEPGDGILLAHLFGMPAVAPRVIKGARIIEDAAHALPVAPFGTMGDAAVFSLRKTLGVAGGGLLVTAGHPAAPPPAARGGTAMRLARTIARATGANILPLRDRLAPDASTDPPAAGADTRSVSQIAHADVDEAARLRRERYAELVARLGQEKAIEIPFPRLSGAATPIGLPVLVEDAPGLERSLRRRGVEAYRWPSADAPEELTAARYPGAADWARRCVVLPAHHGLSARDVERVARATLEGVRSRG